MVDGRVNWGSSPDESNRINWGASPSIRPANPSGFNASYTPSEQSIYDEDLINDTNFVQASKVLYQMNNSADAEPLADDMEYGKYGIEMMGWFNWNLPKMTLDAKRISGATDEQRRAFLYMMNAYDDLGVSWNGAGRFFKGVLADPTTYVGLSTFGVGTLVGKGAAQATKTGVKSLLNQSIKGGVIAGVEAGVYSAADDINRQIVETSVSGEDIDYGRTLKAGAIGTVAGFGLGAGVTAAAKKLGPKPKPKKAPKAETTDDLINDLPLMSIADEVEAQTTAGRLRGGMDAVVRAVKETVPGGKVAALDDAGVQKMDELVRTVEPIKDILTQASAKNPAELAKHLLETNMTDAQSQALEVVSNQTATALKTKVYQLRQQQIAVKSSADKVKNIQDQIDKIEEVIKPIDELDAALSTITGQRLRARQEGLNTGEVRGMTIASLIEGGMTRADAEKKWDSIFADKLIKHERTAEMRGMDKKIEAARQAGNQAEYIRLKHQKKMKLDEFKEEVLAEEGNAVYRAINKPIKVMNEIMISFVFSPATVIINTVPSAAKLVYKPFLNNLMKNGLNKVALRTTMAEYSAMASFAPAAMKAAVAAFKYERSMLTGDSARFLEEYNTIPKKYGGGIVRIFPRLLLSTDALFENIHYRGYTVGKATSKAMEDGLEKGLKGKALDDHVAKKVDESINKAYKPEENAIDILMSDGISRGLKGPKLQNYINKELKKRPEAFTKATDQDGRDYVQDVLFKRDFSGDSAVSQLAKGYEGFVNKHPIMRLAGQLFFRTPVRVFEEGIRLTPGLNLISPSFMADLSGKNGEMRQIRAQGEALMSYAIAGSVFSLYATGNVTGSLGQDYKQRRQAENAAEMEPYSMRFSDGSTFNFRNFDPFSTPIKIMVNALERAEILAYRAEQGERINESEMMAAQAMVAVGIGSIAQSIRDANLASGVDAMVTLFEDLQDPEGSEQLIKFAGQKVQTFLPNTYYKVQMLDNPVLSDPATLEQFIRYRINPQDPLVPRQYTALGRPRTLSNPMANLIYFDTVSNEERKRGVPEKELEVEAFLRKLAIVGDTHFTAPYTHKFLPNVDLRTRMTKDGSESLYDRWMRYTHDSGVIDVLHGLRDLPMGTASVSGMAETEARKALNTFREMAFITLMSEETGIDEEYINSEIRKIEAEVGNRYVPNTPLN